MEKLGVEVDTKVKASPDYLRWIRKLRLHQTTSQAVLKYGQFSCPLQTLVGRWSHVAESKL